MRGSRYFLGLEVHAGPACVWMFNELSPPLEWLSREHAKLSSGWRIAEVQYSCDAHGLLVETNDRGGTATTADDVCIRTEYAKNTTAWILETVKRTETLSQRCSVSPSRPGDVVSDERFSYDGDAYGTAPTKGNVTRTELL